MESENSKHRRDLLSQLDTVPDTESSSLGFNTMSTTSVMSALNPSAVKVLNTDEDGLDMESINSEFNWPSDDNTTTAFSVYEINEHIELKMAAGGFENEFSVCEVLLVFIHIISKLNCKEKASKITFINIIHSFCQRG